MKIKSKRKYEQATNGWHRAVLAEVEDIGLQKTKYGDKEKCRLIFLLDERGSNGKPIEVTDLCTNSDHPDSKLTEYVRLLTGKNPEPDLDTDLLLGCGCRLETQLRTGPTGTYANIVNKAKLEANEKAPAIPLDFVRRANRTPRITRLNGPPLAARPQ